MLERLAETRWAYAGAVTCCSHRRCSAAPPLSSPQPLLPPPLLFFLLLSKQRWRRPFSSRVAELLGAAPCDAPAASRLSRRRSLPWRWTRRCAAAVPPLFLHDAASCANSNSSSSVAFFSLRIFAPLLPPLLLLFERILRPAALPPRRGCLCPSRRVFRIERVLVVFGVGVVADAL